MGGWQTQNMALLFPEMFDYYGVMSMGMFRDGPFGMDPDEYFDEARKNLRNLQEVGYELYWIACGTEDFLFESVEYMTEFLDEMDFEYEYLETGGGHTWDIWRLYLTEFAPMIFR
jgi:enterochelin esterase-like enzyme